MKEVKKTIGILDLESSSVLSKKDKYADLKDEEILARSSEEPELFSVIVDRYENAFLRKGRLILRSDEDAEDAVQEAFVKIYIAAKRFKPVPGASFSSWAYKIFLNHCFSMYKRRKVEKNLIGRLDPEMAEFLGSDQETENLEKKLDTDVLVSAVSKLPNILRRVLTMHFIEGKPQWSIAEAEGISLGAVRARIFRAKKELKKNQLNIKII
ncbi:MAG: RNA polymerase sigma factor [Candidatus Paceibacterota bacterium]|jgi:RNA polymerase sigma-70 factor (ECF subfamily)